MQMDHAWPAMRHLAVPAALWQTVGALKNINFPHANRLKWAFE
jgi:hypothetical protein